MALCEGNFLSIVTHLSQSLLSPLSAFLLIITSAVLTAIKTSPFEDTPFLGAHCFVFCSKLPVSSGLL